MSIFLPFHPELGTRPHLPCRPGASRLEHELLCAIQFPKEKKVIPLTTSEYLSFWASFFLFLELGGPSYLIFSAANLNFPLPECTDSRSRPPLEYCRYKCPRNCSPVSTLLL
ncbi:mCG144882 [Mus musculus]|nr:mCG144882 [Mus musculus]